MKEYYIHEINQHMHINKISLSYITFTNMFWSLLWPSPGCHTRIQTIYKQCTHNV